MSIPHFLLGLICVTAISVGQIFFKLAALNISEYNGVHFLFRQYINKYIIISLIIYAIATVLWIWLLRLLPLNKAYPIMALSFIFVPLISAFMFGEKFELKFLIGDLLIIGGICIIIK